MSEPIVIEGPVGAGSQGWSPGFYDKNDRYYVPKQNVDMAAFPKVNLRDKEPLSRMVVYDQGDVGSCVANASALAFWYELRSMKDSTIESSGPSRYFIYWNALKGDVTDGYTSRGDLEDSGTWNRHAVKILQKLGDCTDDTFPYVPTMGSQNINDSATYKAWFQEYLKKEPEDRCYDEAKKHKIGAYYRLDPDRAIDTQFSARTMEEMDAVGEILLDNLKRCLQDNHPVLFAFRYYWESIPFDETEAIWSVPDIWNGQDKIVDQHHTRPTKSFGGHAVVAVGYDDTKSAILVQNSWGAQIPGSSYQSLGGLFWMPYSWIKDFAATNDFWTIRLQDGDPYFNTDDMDKVVKQKMVDMQR